MLAAWAIAARRKNTLILVHRTTLLEQWREQLALFLGMSRKSIGAVGAGQKKAPGILDIAMLQSIQKKGEAADFVAEYGHVIVDECHHVSAFTFERIMKEVKAKYVLGLTAMPISWRGTLRQYVGRLHRLHENKREVRVYDYIDHNVPMLARMFAKRVRGYRAMGYVVQADNEQLPLPAASLSVGSRGE